MDSRAECGNRRGNHRWPAIGKLLFMSDLQGLRNSRCQNTNRLSQIDRQLTAIDTEIGKCCAEDAVLTRRTEIPWPVESPLSRSTTPSGHVFRSAHRSQLSQRLEQLAGDSAAQQHRAALRPDLLDRAIPPSACVNSPRPADWVETASQPAGIATRQTACFSGCQSPRTMRQPPCTSHAVNCVRSTDVGLGDHGQTSPRPCGATCRTESGGSRSGAAAGSPEPPR